MAGIASGAGVGIAGVGAASATGAAAFSTAGAVISVLVGALEGGKVSTSLRLPNPAVPTKAANTGRVIVYAWFPSVGLGWDLFSVFDHSRYLAAALFDHFTDGLTSSTLGNSSKLSQTCRVNWRFLWPSLISIQPPGKICAPTDITAASKPAARA
jgi:hypothetical protein